MDRFVLTENIRRFRQRLAEPLDDASTASLQAMLAASERELALLDAARAGVGTRWDHMSAEDRSDAETEARAWFVHAYAEAPTLAALIDPKPGLAIVDVNGAYEFATGMTYGQLAGKPLFELFPDNPSDPAANGVANLYASLRTVAETGQEHVMALQRYDTRDAHGRWIERYWRPVNRPVLAGDGELVYLLHVVEEATAEVLAGQSEGDRRG